MEPELDSSNQIKTTNLQNPPGKFKLIDHCITHQIVNHKAVNYIRDL